MDDLAGQLEESPFMLRAVIQTLFITAIAALAAVTTPLLLVLAILLMRWRFFRSFDGLLDAGLMREMVARATHERPSNENAENAHKLLARQIIDSVLFWVAVVAITYFVVEAFFADVSF